MSDLPVGWKAITLGDAASWLSGGTPPTDEPSFWNGDIPWITSGSLTEWRLKQSDRRLTAEGVANGSRIVPAGTVIFVVRGMSLKTEFRIGIAERPLAFGQDCKALRAVEGLDELYLAYAIKAQTAEILDLVDEAGHGTGRLNTDQIKAVRIGLPPVGEQRAIAGVLGALDDKIESNRRLARTGVELARTMLLGGDNRVRLGDVANCEKGLSYKGDDLVEDSVSGLPMINLGNFTTTGWLLNDKLKFYRGEYKERHLVQPGDVVVANTDLTQQRVIIGRPALVPPALGKAIFTHHVTAVRPFSDAKLRLPIWAQLNSTAFRERAEGFATGTTVAGMPVEALLDFEIELPNDSLVNEAQTLLERVWIAEAETSDLTRLRDVLLPALLSGALRVPGADKIVEELV